MTAAAAGQSAAGTDAESNPAQSETLSVSLPSEYTSHVPHTNATCCLCCHQPITITAKQTRTTGSQIDVQLPHWQPMT